MEGRSNHSYYMTMAVFLIISFIWYYITPPEITWEDQFIYLLTSIGAGFFFQGAWNEFLDKLNEAGYGNK